jgi:hypothetical protein
MVIDELTEEEGEAFLAAMRFDPSTAHSESPV